MAAGPKKILLMVSLRIDRQKRKKGYACFLDIYDKGKRKKKFLKLYLTRDYTRLAEDGSKKRLSVQDKLVWAQAQQCLAAERAAFQRGEVFVQNPSEPPCLIDFFEQLCLQKQHSTYEACLQHLRKFLDTQGLGNLRFKELSSNFSALFLDYLQSLSLSPKSVQVYFSRLQIVLNEARKQDPGAMPVQRVCKPRVPESERKYLSEEELRLFILKAPESLTKDAFIFACYTGLRFSDLSRLNWEAAEGNRLRLKIHKTGEFLALPLNDAAQKILLNHGFPGQRGEKIFSLLPSATAVNKYLKKAARAAGLDASLSFHTARHTAATWLLSKGAALYTVSKILGHKSSSTTRIYAQLIDRKKEEALQALPDLLTEKEQNNS